MTTDSLWTFMQLDGLHLYCRREGAAHVERAAALEALRMYPNEGRELLCREIAWLQERLADLVALELDV